MSKKASAAKAGARAAIYVRVSSEAQADPEKSSPTAQEADCRALCEQKGYRVVEVYRDTERYRVGKRMVEPSGTQADRPQLRRMLADARAGQFDVIIAWREDRLYRAMRPMVDVLECLEETGIDIELAKEHFDRSIAPVKAWAARLELTAKHDRFTMGVAGRLEGPTVGPPGTLRLYPGRRQIHHQ
jgi:site-specific DNA recombinase